MLHDAFFIIFKKTQIPNMKYILFIILFIVPISIQAQKSLDTRIYITITDTTNWYEKVRVAFVDEDFIVKDNSRKDTLYTYPNNTVSTSYIYAFATIKGNIIELWGFLGDSHLNVLGYTVNPGKNDYKKIFYYKRDKYWNKLMAIAKRLNGTLSYGKEKGRD